MEDLALPRQVHLLFEFSSGYMNMGGTAADLPIMVRYRIIQYNTIKVFDS